MTFNLVTMLELAGLLAVLCLCGVGYVIRIRSIAAAIKKGADKQTDERMQIAREQYDNLLQGLQGLLLSFHVAAEGVPFELEARKALDRALDLADRIILESRDRINRLKVEHVDSTNLEPAIRSVADEFCCSAGISLSLQHTGSVRTLNSEIADEVFIIAREAVTNAFRHSGASQIAIALDYGKEQFTFVCWDDGRGFKLGEERTVMGHWGLRCMARQAAKIGAEFDCHSAPGEGVQIRVVVPAVRAYARAFGLDALFPGPNAH